MKKRRYRRRRFMRRKTYRRRRMRPEVKYYTTAANGLAAYNQNVSTVDLKGFQIFGNSSAEGILSGINQGGGANQRIGSKIRIIGIRIRGFYWLCPAPGDTAVYTSVLVRLLAGAIPSNFGGADVPNFWGQVITNHVSDYPARSDFRIYLDKTIRLHDSYGILAANRQGKGAMVPFNFKLKFRKGVEFKFNQSAMRDSADRIQFAHLAFTPNTADNVQVACMNNVIRVYYTDV